MNIEKMTPAERLAVWDENDRPERWNSGDEHHLADLIIRDLRAVSSPPADDVREALAEVTEKAREGWLLLSDNPEYGADAPTAIADAILATFEVRSRGTVTPPAEDVREALYKILRFGSYDEEMQAVNLILSRFEVRPYGTVTDAEVEAAAGVIARSDDSPYGAAGEVDQFFEVARAALEAAREARLHGTVTDAERYVAALRAIADGDGPTFVREFARDALGNEVRPRGTVAEAEKSRPGILHIASGTGTACGLPRNQVSHITDGARYADCAECLRMAARS